MILHSMCQIYRLPNGAYDFTYSGYMAGARTTYVALRMS